MRLELRMMLMAAAVTAGCVQRTESAVPPAGPDKENAMTSEATGGGEPVRNLPSSFGHSFASLDDYLAHLQRYAGPVGQPWYRQIRPGVYEMVTTIVPAREPRIFTRAELMRRFGFDR